MAWASDSPVFGPSANNFFSGDVIPGRYGLLTNEVKLCFFFKVLKSKNKNFLLLFSPFYRSTKVPFNFPRKSVEHVMDRNKATNTFTQSLTKCVAEHLILMMT